MTKRAEGNVPPARLPVALCAADVGQRGYLKDIPEADDNSPVTTVSSTLVQEVRIVDTTFRNAEVARVCQIKEVSTKLNPLVFADSRILHDTEVHAIDAVSAQDVAPCITRILSRV